MPRYVARIAYDGTHFSGFQRQPSTRTVQSVLEETLTRLNGGIPVTVYASGRTDAGVHAYGQVIHFDMIHQRPVEKLRFALDTQTDDALTIRNVVCVSEPFHARFDATDKVYHYYFKAHKVIYPWQKQYMTHMPYSLNIKRMQEGLMLCEGTHDFTGFCASGSAVQDKVRTIYKATLTLLNAVEQIYCISFYGDGFLYKMVRNLMGTLFKIGLEQFPVTQITDILTTHNRQLAGPTAPSQGLYLMHVGYQFNQQGEELWENEFCSGKEYYLWG